MIKPVMRCLFASSKVNVLGVIIVLVMAIEEFVWHHNIPLITSITDWQHTVHNSHIRQEKNPNIVGHDFFFTRTRLRAGGRAMTFYTQDQWQ